jgi:hypothetical protein
METTEKVLIFNDLLDYVGFHNPSWFGHGKFMDATALGGSYIRAIVDVVDNITNCRPELFSAVHDVYDEWMLLAAEIRPWIDLRDRIDRLEKAIHRFQEEWQKQFK